MTLTRSDRPFDHLVFDLDDTLLDTSGQLVPRASREACTAMIAAGLATNVDACLVAWQDHAREHVRRDLFSHLVSRFGVRNGSDSIDIARRGHHAFYHRKVETDIELFPGAREMLLELHGSYRLHLVTAGVRSTQEEKIRILGIREVFDSINHVDPGLGQRKRDAFAAIAVRTGSRPERYLSIGNRVDTDVGEAKEVGWTTCWVRYGEHVTMTPSNELEKPDFQINHVTELRLACRL